VKKFSFHSLTLILVFVAKIAPAAPPNILVFLADDVGWSDFGCYGNDAIHTPNIDSLAQNGLRFTKAFLTSPQCSPTRISVLAGKYPHATGAEDLHMPLPEGEKLVPTYLKQAGYFTGHMRKTHYGPNGEKQFDWYSKDKLDFPGFLDKAGERPFFMWVGFRDAHRGYEDGAFDPPHDPAQVKVPPYLRDTPETRKDLAMYYDEIARLDSDIGTMVAELEKRGELENTLIVYFNDNGAPFPRAKGTLYDSGMRTALIAQWPAKIEAGGVQNTLASVIDLAPTFLEAAGVAVPEEMQGRSMLPVLLDASQKGREQVFAERNWHNGDEHMRCVRTQFYKLIHNNYTHLPHGTPSDLSASPSWAALAELRGTGQLSRAQEMLFDQPRPEWELYDTEADPWETNNLAYNPDYREVFLEMSAELFQWQEETGDFPPTSRTRPDNVDRYTGEKFTKEVAPQVP
jgi:arylsulfatase A-like enzyme